MENTLTGLIGTHMRVSARMHLCMYACLYVCVRVYLQCKSARLFVCEFTSLALVDFSYSQFGAAVFVFVFIAVTFVAVIFSVNFFHLFVLSLSFFSH